MNNLACYAKLKTMADVNSDFASAIKEAIEETKLQKQHVASEAKIHPTSLSRILAGKGVDNKRCVTVRFNEAEALRFKIVCEKAKKRNEYARESDIIRELLKLNKPYALTEEEINYFRTGKKNEPT